MTDPLRILIAEDNQVLREILVALIDAEVGLKCVAATGILDEVVALAIATEAQVVILDVELRGQSSLKMLPHLRGQLPQLKIVMYSGHNLPPLMNSALAAGASAYVVKGADFNALITAVRTCAVGAF